jgi:hypothetical protein
MKRMMAFLVSIIVIAIVLLGLAYLFQEKLIFFPEKLDSGYEFSFPAPFTERNFKISERITINALHFKTRDPGGVILYFHGNAGSMRSWCGIAADFLAFHYDFLIIDYRGYGKSTGKISEQALYHDAQAVYDSLKKEYAENEIIVFGRSIGTGIAAWLASHNDPAKLILESPYYSLPDLARHYYSWLPGRLLRYQFPNHRYLENVKCQVHIIHGSDDEIIPVNASYRLAEKLKPGDEMVIVEGGRHNDLGMFGEYKAFLEKCLIE